MQSILDAMGKNGLAQQVFISWTSINLLHPSFLYHKHCIDDKKQRIEVSQFIKYDKDTFGFHSEITALCLTAIYHHGQFDGKALRYRPTAWRRRVRGCVHGQTEDGWKGESKLLGDNSVAAYDLDGGEEEIRTSCSGISIMETICLDRPLTLNSIV
jgi:hypothetical protein